jgi:oligopeptide transport system substrate-binding protein
MSMKDVCKKIALFLSILSIGFTMACAKSNRKESRLEEQHLRINVSRPPLTFDPRKGTGMIASQIHYMLFEGLMKIEPDLTVIPAQAKSVEISPDGKIYTFHLRNTKWSDGTAVTAFDFEKSWKQILDPRFPCLDTYLLYCIKNAEQAKKGKVPLSEVGIFAKDCGTFIVELETPTPHFLQIVASSLLLPVSSSIEEKHPDWATSTKYMVSNGPFVLKEWKFNQEMIFEKNPKYHGANAVKLNRISVDIIDREMAVLHMYGSGHFDLIGTLLSFFPSALQQELQKENLFTFFPAAMSKLIAFNTTQFPFHNVNMRRAFALAINRKAIVEHITQLKEKEALSLIPPALLRRENIPLIADGDEIAAKKYFELGMKELNITIKDLKSISLLFYTTEVNHLISQELQNRWERVLGVKVRCESVEFKTLHDRAAKGDFTIGTFVWLALYGDPIDILSRFTDPTNHRNYSKWKNEHYNTLIRESLHMSSQDAYLEKLQEAEKLLVEEMPITCLYHDCYTFLIHPYVKGFAVSPLGHIYFEKMSICKTPS